MFIILHIINIFKYFNIFHDLYPETARLSHGCKSMANKLITYAKDQLPDGRYWDPEPETKEILSQLEPNNDLCESILGLNDYLFTTIPNMDQLTRSNMVQN